MRSVKRRNALVAIVGVGGSAVGGYAWYRYSSGAELRLDPVELSNSNTDPQDIYLRIYDEGRFEYAETHTLGPANERVGGDDTYTSKTLDGEWTETPREYAIVASHEGVEWHLTNAEIRSELDDDDPESDCAHVSVSIAGIHGEGKLNVHISASRSC